MANTAIDMDMDTLGSVSVRVGSHNELFHVYVSYTQQKALSVELDTLATLYIQWGCSVKSTGAPSVAGGTGFATPKQDSQPDFATIAESGFATVAESGFATIAESGFATIAN